MNLDHLTMEAPVIVAEVVMVDMDLVDTDLVVTVIIMEVLVVVTLTMEVLVVGYGHHGGPGGGYVNHHHGGSGGHSHHGRGGEWRKIRIDKKLAWINQQLTDYASTDDSKLAPRDQFKKQRLLKKKQKLEDNLKEEKTPKPEKRSLTTEEEQFNHSLKLQLWEVKAEVAKVKARERELKLILQSKPGDKAILDELVSLKERKQLLKLQKKALWEKFHT